MGRRRRRRGRIGRLCWIVLLFVGGRLGECHDDDDDADGYTIYMLDLNLLVLE